MPYEYECYQKNSLIKELLLLEGHLTSYKCQWCILKHKLTIQALAEETYRITPIKEEKTLFKTIFTLNLDNVEVVRRLRSLVMETLPVNCNFKVVKYGTDKI